MIAEKPQLVSSEIMVSVLFGIADIPLTLKDFTELPIKKCVLQTVIKDFPDNTVFMIHEYRSESIIYIVNYDNFGKLMAYDRLLDQDKGSILTIRPTTE
jgi:hypothetical protein